MQRSPWWGVPPERRAPPSGWQDKVWRWVRAWVASKVPPKLGSLIDPSRQPQPDHTPDASA